MRVADFRYHRAQMAGALAAVALLLVPSISRAAARSVVVILHNQTPNTMRLASAGLAHGEWTNGTQPPAVIGPNATAQWESESNGFLTGTEGTADYTMDNVTGNIHLHWDDPYAGSNSYDESAPAGVIATHAGGGGDNATITFTVQYVPAPGSAPMDLVWTAEDANHLALNPRWRFAVDHGTPPDAEGLCPGQSFGMPCTTQGPSIDKWDNLIPGLCDGDHFNWQVATYTGPLSWSEYSGAWPNDYDYNITIAGPGGAGSTTTSDPGGTVKGEFDSRETINHFGSPWWSQFRNAVNDGDGPAAALVNGKQAIMVGLVGLDCVHECHPELHPVFALAFDAGGPNDNDVWPVFVRNWGNEGMCSTMTHYLDLPGSGNQHVFVFELPWKPGATSVDVAPGTEWRTNNNAVLSPHVSSQPGVGVQVSFNLPDPEAGARISGELHLNWHFFVLRPGGIGRLNPGILHSIQPAPKPLTTTPGRVSNHEVIPPPSGGKITLKGPLVAHEVESQLGKGSDEEDLAALLAHMTVRQQQVFLSRKPPGPPVEMDSIVRNGATIGTFVKLSGEAGNAVKDRATPDRGRAALDQRDRDAALNAFGGKFPAELLPAKTK